MRKRKTRSNQNVASVIVKLKYHFPESQTMRKLNTKCIILISFPSFSQQPSKRRISVKQNLKKARVPVCVKSKSTESKARARFFCAWPGSRAKNRRSNRISKSELRSPLKSLKRRAATPSLETKRRRSNGSEKVRVYHKPVDPNL